MRGERPLDETGFEPVRVVSTKKKKKKKKKKTKTRNVDIEEEVGPSSLPRYGTRSLPAPILTTARDSPTSEGGRGRSSLLLLPSAKSPAMRVAQTVDADDWMVGSTSPERMRFIPERTKHGRSRPMTREKAKPAAARVDAVVEDDGNRMLSISMPDRKSIIRGSSAIWSSRERALMASATAAAAAEAQAAVGESPSDRSRGDSISSDDARTPRSSAVRFATPTGVSSPVSPPGIRRFDDVPSIDAG